MFEIFIAQSPFFFYGSFVYVSHSVSLKRFSFFDLSLQPIMRVLSAVRLTGFLGFTTCKYFPLLL